nr:hypothetical protein Iba_chr05dCG5560 [Ipomoea batatas]
MRWASEQHIIRLDGCGDGVECGCGNRTARSFGQWVMATPHHSGR